MSVDYVQKGSHSKYNIPRNSHRMIDSMCNRDVENTTNENTQISYSNKMKILNCYHKVIDTMHNGEVAHPIIDIKNYTYRMIIIHYTQPPCL